MTVYQIAQIGSILYVATNVGLYYSTDLAITWVSIPTTNFGVYAVKGTPGRIVIISVFGYRYSTNGGSSWTDATGDPSNPTSGELILFDGKYWAITGNSPSQVLRSMDNGVTYSAYNTGLVGADAIAQYQDRLISVLPRTLGPLDPDDAEALLCRPIPTFPPDVFGDDAARTILAHTGRHPFLIQAVGKAVVQRLLKDKRRVATGHDVERALDGVFKIAEGALFTYLWDAFDPAERAVMRALADDTPVDSETGTFRVLREQWFVDLQDGQPVVTFPLFARWIRDYRGEHPAGPTHDDSMSPSALV